MVDLHDYDIELIERDSMEIQRQSARLPALSNQVVISYAAYNSNNPLVK